MTAVAVPYAKTSGNGPGYSGATPEAAVQPNRECADGNDGLRPSLKNLPCPLVVVGRSGANTTLSASLTPKLLIKASPESNPVSRARDFPCQLPQTYIAAGTATSAATPPFATLSLRLMARALEGARTMLCCLLPMSTPTAPP